MRFVSCGRTNVSLDGGVWSGATQENVEDGCEKMTVVLLWQRCPLRFECLFRLSDNLDSTVCAQRGGSF